jgi:hypothetical protein
MAPAELTDTAVVRLLVPDQVPERSFLPAGLLDPEGKSAVTEVGFDHLGDQPE